MHPQYVKIHENRLLGDGGQLGDHGPQALDALWFMSRNPPLQREGTFPVSVDHVNQQIF